MNYTIIKRWLPLAITITLLCGLIYSASQNVLRSSANDPQIQLAEDVATKMSKGAYPSAVMPNDKVDIGASLSPFVAVYDQKGNAQATSGYLNNNLPKLPNGVFDYAKNHDIDKITWQPQKDVRVALVVKYFKGKTTNGFVASGRSLREVEKRESNLTWLVSFGWLVTMLASLIAVRLTDVKLTKKQLMQEK